MGLKGILVCLDSTTAADGRLQLAMRLARIHRSYLAAAFIMPQPAAAASELSATRLPLVSERGMIGLAGGGLIVGDVPATPRVPRLSHEAERAETVEQRFTSELRLQGLGGEWHLFDQGEQDEVIELAKTTDLTITGQISPDARSIGCRPEDIALGAARPVLVVPYAGAFDTVGRRALVAWDGTREAVRAVNDALPLLGDAEVVKVIFVRAHEADLDRRRLSLDRVLRHLQRHGIAADAEETPQGSAPISDILLSRAADNAADLIVAGVYHHSPLRESLIGGVSRDILEHMTVPVLMSH